MNLVKRLSEIEEIQQNLEIEKRAIQRKLSLSQKLSRDELLLVMEDMREMASKVFREGADPNECREALWNLNERLYNIEIKER